MKDLSFTPKIFTTFKEGYSARQFLNDLIAGVIVGIVALPLAIAFGIASGVGPERGLITAIVAGFIISFLGGSRVQIGGPTGAFVVILYGIVQQYGYDGLVVASVMAGIMLVVMGFAKLGSVIKFIPYPVTVGFTAGIGFVIFFTQIKDFLGLRIEHVPAEFFEKCKVYIENIGTFNPWALGTGLLALGILIFFPKLTKKVPASIVSIVATTLAVALFKLPVDTIGSLYGSVPNTFPAPHLPQVNFQLIAKLIPSAFSIAVLAGIESLLSAVVADGMTGTRHRSSMELIAQGVANIVSPIMGGIPATGAIARTATNIKSGGRSPVAGIVHSLTLLLIMLFFGKWTAFIPMPALAAILISVAYHMSEVHIFVKLFRSPKSDIAVLLLTFIITVCFDLTIAIEVGIVLAAILFMRRMSMVTTTGNITRNLDEEADPDDPQSVAKRKIPKGVEVFEIFGAFFFGAAEKFKDTLREVAKRPKVIVLIMRDVFTMDATGMRALEDVIKASGKEGTRVILCGLHAQPLYALQNSGLLDLLPKENLQPTLDDSLKRADVLLGEV